MFDHACAVFTGDHLTDIGIKVYSNRILLITTHYKKFGSLISVNRESSVNDFESNTYSTKTLFGKDDIEILAAARYIAEQININKPLLLSLSLKDYNVETLKIIADTVNKIKPW